MRCLYENAGKIKRYYAGEVNTAKTVVQDRITMATKNGLKDLVGSLAPAEKRDPSGLPCDSGAEAWRSVCAAIDWDGKFWLSVAARLHGGYSPAGVPFFKHLNAFQPFTTERRFL